MVDKLCYNIKVFDIRFMSLKMSFTCTILVNLSVQR